jgi:hypothetical protein
MLRHLAGILLFVLYLPVAQATLREIQPGEHAELAADEGLLRVSVDTDFALGGVRSQRAGSVAATFLRAC